MQKPNYTSPNYTPIQLKLPLEIERIIDISDPVYSFNEIMNRIDLKKILALKESGMGRPRCDAEGHPLLIHGERLSLPQKHQKSLPDRHSLHVASGRDESTLPRNVRELH